MSEQMTARSPVVLTDAYEDANKSYIKAETREAKDSDLFYKHVSLKPADDIHAR